MTGNVLECLTGVMLVSVIVMFLRAKLGTVISPSLLVEIVHIMHC